MITIITGLSGSGKTSLLNFLNFDLKYEDGLEQSNWEHVYHSLNDSIDINIGICGQSWTDWKKRDSLDKIAKIKINYIFFENNPKKCISNIIYDSVVKGHKYGDHRLWCVLNNHKNYYIYNSIPIKNYIIDINLVEIFFKKYRHCENIKNKTLEWLNFKYII